MNRTRRRSLAVIAVLGALAAGGLAACSSDAATGASGSGDGSKAALDSFKVVLDWSPNTNHNGMYLAKEKGWYADAGLDVTFLEPGDAGSLQVLAGGKADVAVSVQEELIPARAAGLPVQSIAAILQHNTSSLVSLASDGITRPKDLEGKTYGGYGGQLETALLDKLVRCDGGDPKKVKSVDVGESDYRVGLERNQYDAVWIFDGWDGIHLQQQGVKTNTIPFIDHTDCIPDWYTPLLATSTKVEQSRPDDLKAFMAATARGYREAMADPDAASAALLAQTHDLDPKLVKASSTYLSTRYADDPKAWGQQQAKVWDDFSAFLLEAGLIDKQIDVGAAWTDDYLPGS
ncbi:ABC transporter substrate-binding protein [Aquihabitans sp. McL0605]|uniref:ABC transporter substrate-binding protein n=1 Tax=Aquihabitans sp. McL0605 TaxID=3415671 RepID=UPI003CEE1551